MFFFFFFGYCKFFVFLCEFEGQFVSFVGDVLAVLALRRRDGAGWQSGDSGWHRSSPRALLWWVGVSCACQADGKEQGLNTLHRALDKASHEHIGKLVAEITKHSPLFKALSSRKLHNDVLVNN